MQIINRSPNRLWLDLMHTADRTEDVQLNQIEEREQSPLRVRGNNEWLGESRTRAGRIGPAENPGADRGGRQAQIMRRLSDEIDRQLRRFLPTVEVNSWLSSLRHDPVNHPRNEMSRYIPFDRYGPIVPSNRPTSPAGLKKSRGGKYTVTPKSLYDHSYGPLLSRPVR